MMARPDRNRKCGDCAACCTTHGVPELEKKLFTPCSSLRPGPKPCSIYADRPESCRGFKCLWLQGIGANKDRPDRIGSVLDLEDGVHGRQIVKAFVLRERERGRSLLNQLALHMIVYVLREDGSRQVLGPEQERQEFFQAVGPVGMAAFAQRKSS